MKRIWYPGIKLLKSVRNSFQSKILIVSLGGVLFSILLSGLIFYLGMIELEENTSAEIEYSLGAASKQSLEAHIEGTAEQLNLRLGHAQADLRILADITQKLIDHRQEFIPLTKALSEIPFFADKMQYYPDGGYSQNSPDKPTVVTLQTIYHDKNGNIKPYPQQIIDETSLLNLIMPVIHTQGAEKMWTYFAGDEDAGFLRLTPWVDFGKDAIENYPEQMDVSYWTWFPGLIEAWGKWLEDPGSHEQRPSDIVTFLPAIDATSGESIQIFGHPLWNRERTRCAGAVWYDLDLTEVTAIIEDIELTESGFAFLVLGDGNVIAIPDRGVQAMGLQERVIGDGNLLRSLAESKYPEVAALILPQDDAVSFLELKLSGGDYFVMMRRLDPMNVFLDGEDQTSVQYWTLGFAVPKNEIYAPLSAAQTNVERSFKKILVVQAGVLVLIIVFIFGMISFITGRMTRGLSSLTAGASQIAQGDFDTRVENLSKDEIGSLANAFNLMARQLKENFDRLELRNKQLEKEVLERQQAEKELRESEERLRQVVENMPVMMNAFDAQGNILIWNKECERVTGYLTQEMVYNPKAIELLYPDLTYRQQMEIEWLERGNHYYDWEWELTAKDGTVKTVSWSNISDRLPIPGWAAWGTGVDVTERVHTELALKEHSERLDEMVEERTKELKEAQKELVRQEKLAMLGKLASGVAHELRHPLGVIQNAIYYLETVLQSMDPVINEYFAMIDKESHAAAMIISNLLDYAFIKPAPPEKVEVNILVDHALENHPAPEGINIEVDIEADTPALLVNLEQIDSVLTALIANAYQAMPEGGKVSVICGQEKNMDGLLTTEEDEPLVYIKVKDSGVGISAQDFDKIFEPLFTTKARGIGLGLAITKNLVEANGGRIEVKSVAGEGSTFSIYLPAWKNYES